VFFYAFFALLRHKNFKGGNFMKITIQDALLTPGSERGRSGLKLEPKGVVVHYVGNPGSTAMGNRNYFENGGGGLRVSAHYIVGLNGEILRCVPENERANHAGRAYNTALVEKARTNNATYLGIETCHPDAGGRFNAQTYRSLVGLLAEICVRYGFCAFKDVKTHFDVTAKRCPLYYVQHPNMWRELQKAVYCGILVYQCHEFGLDYDPAYWERVMSGEIIAKDEYVWTLEMRIKCYKCRG
jgi:N-acetylmuramoyl-L-alanine amidase CwlA